MERTDRVTLPEHYVHSQSCFLSFIFHADLSGCTHWLCKKEKLFKKFIADLRVALKITVFAADHIRVVIDGGSNRFYFDPYAKDSLCHLQSFVTWSAAEWFGERLHFLCVRSVIEEEWLPALSQLESSVDFRIIPGECKHKRQGERMAAVNTALQGISLQSLVFRRSNEDQETALEFFKLMIIYLLLSTERAGNREVVPYDLLSRIDAILRIKSTYRALIGAVSRHSSWLERSSKEGMTLDPLFCCHPYFESFLVTRNLWLANDISVVLWVIVYLPSGEIAIEKFRADYNSSEQSLVVSHSDLLFLGSSTNPKCCIFSKPLSNTPSPSSIHHPPYMIIASECYLSEQSSLSTWRERLLNTNFDMLLFSYAYNHTEGEPGFSFVPLPGTSREDKSFCFIKHVYCGVDSEEPPRWERIKVA